MSLQQSEQSPQLRPSTTEAASSWMFGIGFSTLFLGKGPDRSPDKNLRLQQRTEIDLNFPVKVRRFLPPPGSHASGLDIGEAISRACASAPTMPQ
jgi:hypothetical protein